MTTHSRRTFEQPYRTFAASVFNLVGRQLRQWGWRRRLSMDAILDKARRWTKLSDWGDERFREPLQVLLTSLEEDARLHPLGRLLCRLNCTFLAANRLRVRQFLQTHPEVLAKPVRKPLFVVGLPRTGTTLLHNLLCQDPGGRPLLLWEALHPAPDAATDAGKPDRRPLVAQRFVTLINRWGAPQLRTVHPLKADGPEECTFLLFSTFVTPAFFLYGDVRGYIEWLRGPGRDYSAWCYEQYRSYLQVLQWRRRPLHWVLKSPAHSFGLDALLTLFPDACVIQTHRDMKKVVPSACSLFAISHGLYSDEVDSRQLGGNIAQLLRGSMLERVASARERHPARVFDVSYPSLVADPIGTVRAIYHYFGLEVPESMEPRMRRWLARNPANKHGVHQYDLAQFGLTPKDIDRDFGAYQERFAAPSLRERGGSSAGGDQVGRVDRPPQNV
jgi:hypothetical protein